jgi:hypothetical protein
LADQKNKFPPVPKQLLEKLEALFPDRCPDPEDTLDDIRVKTGEVRVVRLLRHHFDAQHKTTLPGT